MRLIVLSLLLSVVSAAPAKPAWPESDTVLDLLRADARAAARQRLGHAQDWLSSSSPVPQPASLSAPGMPGRDGQDRVDVLAIYGVGRTLHADVAVKGAHQRELGQVDGEHAVGGGLRQEHLPAIG